MSAFEHPVGCRCDTCMFEEIARLQDMVKEMQQELTLAEQRAEAAERELREEREHAHRVGTADQRRHDKDVTALTARAAALAEALRQAEELCAKLPLHRDDVLSSFTHMAIDDTLAAIRRALAGEGS